MVDAMKVLITGASGNLGTKLVKYCNIFFDVIPTYKNKKLHKNAKKMNITSLEEVNRVLRSVKPDIIIHAAAMTNVDACEIHRNTARLVNAIGTKNIVNKAEEIGSKIVYISTDYVFDGKRGMYNENDRSNPINYYGLTKLEGENIVKKYSKDFIIVRPSVLYGLHPYKVDFVSWVINNLKNRVRINVVTDQFNSPTLTNDLANMIIKLINNDETGIFHGAGREKISRFNFAIKIAKIFDLDKNLINPITSDKLTWIAKRPKDSSLNVSKISKIKKPLNIFQALKKLKEEMI